MFSIVLWPIHNNNLEPSLQTFVLCLCPYIVPAASYLKLETSHKSMSYS